MIAEQELLVEYSDADLVRAYLLSQNKRYFDEIYKRYSNKIYYKCYSLLNNMMEAEDATQDIFLKMILNLAKFSGQSQFSTWLYSMTYNHCIDIIRRGKKNKVMFSENDEMIKEEVEEDNAYLVKEASLSAMQATLDIIDEADRTLLIMKYADNMMVRDIAEILKLSESAVKMRLKRAKEKFQKIYQDQMKI